MREVRPVAKTSAHIVADRVQDTAAANWSGLSRKKGTTIISGAPGTALTRMDALRWMKAAPEDSVHAVVTDPPYGLVEYEEKDHAKMRAGRGGVWRIPPSFDGAQRAPLPRFTVLTGEDRSRLERFFGQVARRAMRVLVPGGHLLIASNPLVSSTVFAAIERAGFEKAMLYLPYPAIRGMNGRVAYNERRPVGKLTDPVDFVFDEQGKQLGQALEIWKFCTARMSPEMAAMIGTPPISRNDKKWPPLQAADFAAWQIRRQFDMPVPSRLASSVHLARDHGFEPKIMVEYLDRHYLESIRDGIDAKNLATLSADVRSTVEEILRLIDGSPQQP